MDDAASYSVDNSCDAYTSFILQGSGRIVVDGSTDLNEENGNHCYNQSPTFSVNQLAYIKEDGTTAWVNTEDIGIYFDWFKGTESLYHAQQYTDGDSTFSIADALLKYRTVYPTASDYTLPALNTYTEAMRQVIMTLATDGKGDNSTLVLKKKTFSPYIPTKGTYVFLAIPVIATFTDKDSYYSVCLDEQQIIYEATDQAPEINHGIPGVTYGTRTKVPIRMGLGQIQQITSADKVITIPIREVKIVSSDSHVITIHDANHSLKVDTLFLTDTDDPALIDSALEFKEVGHINIIQANNQVTNTTDDIKNYLQAYFYPSFVSNVKEGYTYTFKYYYAERNADNTDYTNTCEGNSYIIIKIVPAYETWIGGASADNQDWNNDANWRRSDNEELYKSSDDYTSNAKNTTSNGFVPLDFTNITILKGDSVSTVPVLKTHEMNTDNVLDLDTTTATADIAYDMVLKDNGSGFGCQSYYENTCRDLYLKPEAEIMNAQLLTYGEAHIDYELTPRRWYLLSSPLQGVYAGDMYAPKGTARQETDAFEDITFDNTLADNDRFNPAVYQRSWDKDASIVYNYADGGTDGERNVFVKADWSYVYNDVDVPYNSGNGFSIKVVPGSGFTSGNKVLFRLPKADMSYAYFKKDGTEGSSKDITRTHNGRLFTDTLATANPVTVSVTNSSTDNALYLVGNLFPCQMDMDAFLSNTANAALLDSKYWLMTADGQDAVVFGDQTVSTSETSGTTVAPMQGFFVKLKDGVTNTGTLSLTFDKSMMTGQSAGITSPQLRAKATGSSTEKKLWLSATCNGQTSRAVLVNRTGTSDDFADNEDVELLDQSLYTDIPLVYSIAGNTAAQINQFSHCTSVPVGVMRGDSDEVKVTISGISGFEDGVSLYDATEHSTTPLHQDTTVVWESNASGRYFLLFHSTPTGIMDYTINSGISFYMPGRGELQVMATDADSPLKEVNIYRTGGELVARRTSLESMSETFTLPSGLYIVRARTDQTEKTGKITIH